MITLRRMIRLMHVARMGTGIGIYRDLVGKSKSKKPLRKPRCRWENNIKVNRHVLVSESMDWIKLAQDRDWWREPVYAVMKLRVP
jgi:hypothetical protein